MRINLAEKIITEARVAEANRKAERHGLGHPFTLLASDYDVLDDTFEVEIAVTGRTGWEGWALAGLIRWNEAAPLVSRFPTYEGGILRTPAEPTCDHCRTARSRSITFLVTDPTGALRQVGTSCLEVYTGIHPEIALLTDGLDIPTEGGSTREVWGTDFVLHAAVALTDALGYVRTSEGARSTVRTFYRVLDRTTRPQHPEYGKHIAWGPEQTPEAEAVRAWCLAGATEDSEYRVSLAEAAAHDQIGPRALALVLSAVASYRRDMARQEEARLLALTAAPVPTGRVEVTGEVLRQKVTFGHYGETVKITVRTDAGWLAYGTCPKALAGVEIGQRVTFTATLDPSDRVGYGWFSRPTKARIIAHALAA